MKKLLLLVFGLFSYGQASAQYTMADMFSGKAKVVFLGLDFTQAKYIGRAGFMDPTAIQNQHMASWYRMSEARRKSKMRDEDGNRFVGGIKRATRTP